MIRDYRNWRKTNETAGRRRSDTPNEHWQSQQKTALAKLARSEALGGRVEDRYYPGVDHIDAIIAVTSMFRGRAPVLADIKAFIDKTRAEHR